jgi:hypothetical protein
MADSQGQAIWAGINESGRLLRAGPVETDAKWFVARATPEGAVAYWLVEATRLIVNGREVFSVPRRRTVEQLTIKASSPGRLR